MGFRRIAPLLLLAVYALAASAPCPDLGSNTSEVRWVQANSAPPSGWAPVPASADSGSSAEPPIMQMACPCGCHKAPSALAGLGVVQFLAPGWAELEPPESTRRESAALPALAPTELPKPDPVPKPSVRLS